MEICNSFLCYLQKISRNKKAAYSRNTATESQETGYPPLNKH